MSRHPLRTAVPLGLFCLLALAAQRDPAAPHATCAQGPDPDAAASCGTCHTEHLKEWHGTAHARAWTDELYQAEMAKKDKPELCMPCHIPVSVHADLGDKPKVRDKLKDDGVHCATCHRSADGKEILGPFGAKTEAHPSAKSDAFTTRDGSIELCSSCHETMITPVLPLAKDWKQVHGKDPKAKTCIECHMAEAERPLAVDPKDGKPAGAPRKGRSHKVLGPADSEFAAQAFAFEAKAAGKELQLQIENKAGHRIPGLYKLRKFVVHVAQQDGDGKELARGKVELYWDPTTDAKGLDASGAGAKRTFPFALADGAKRVELTVDHLLVEKKVNTVLTTTLEL